MKRLRRAAKCAAMALAGVVLLVGTQVPEAPDDEVDEVVTIKAVGSQLAYETTQVRLEAGTTVTIRLDNSESSMPHNIVLLEEQADIQSVGIAALQAQQTDYVPEGEADKIVAHTALASPGEVVEFTIEVPPPGEYPYICTYPGHFQTMRGTLISVEST